MSGASSTAQVEVLKENSKKCSEKRKENCSIEQTALVEECVDLVEELSLTVGTKLEEDGEIEEDGGEELENLLLHGYRSDLKWSMKDYRPPKYTYVRYRYV